MQPTTTLKPSLVGLVSAGKTVDQIAATLGTTADQARDALANAGLLDLVEDTAPAPAPAPALAPAPAPAPATPRRRGRPPKAAAQATPAAAAAPAPAPAPATPRRRGRPPKAAAQAPTAAAPATSRRRGRPPKARAASTSTSASTTTLRARLVGTEAFAALGELAAGALERNMTVEAYVVYVKRAYALAQRLGLA